MAGIVSFGAYIPYSRLPRSVIKTAWGGSGGRGERSISGIDEDAITMAVNAGMDCLHGLDSKTVGALFFATTTAPYKERLNATIVATALDFPKDARNTDFCNCLRAGTGALMAAVDAVKAKTLQSVLVATADNRLAGANSEMEPLFGDGAAALLIGEKNVAAEIEGTHTISADIVDYWRAHDDTYVRSWEDRFGVEQGYNKIPVEAAAEVLKKCKLQPKDISKVCLYGVETRRHAELGKIMGFTPEQMQDPLLDVVGDTGTPLSIMLLIAALEKAKVGDRLLVVSWGNGADALVLRVTEHLAKIKGRRGIQGHLQAKRQINTFGRYLLWRDMVSKTPSYLVRGMGVSMAAEWREKYTGLPLYGVKCLKCGTVQLFLNPASTRARICLECQAKDNFEPYRFAEKKGTVVTFSHDYLGGGIDPPITRTVIDFDGGGRGMFEMSDYDPNECKVGMKVEMTFRTRGYENGVHAYCWKCKPVREQNKGGN